VHVDGREHASAAAARQGQAAHHHSWCCTTKCRPTRSSQNGKENLTRRVQEIDTEEARIVKLAQLRKENEWLQHKNLQINQKIRSLELAARERDTTFQNLKQEKGVGDGRISELLNEVQTLTMTNQPCKDDTATIADLLKEVNELKEWKTYSTSVEEARLAILAFLYGRLGFAPPDNSRAAFEAEHDDDVVSRTAQRISSCEMVWDSKNDISQAELEELRNSADSRRGSRGPLHGPSCRTRKAS
jgi:chromosome segregation ATPase